MIHHIRSRIATHRARRAREQALTDLQDRIAKARAAHQPVKHLQAEVRRVTHEAMKNPRPMKAGG